MSSEWYRFEQQTSAGLPPADEKPPKRWVMRWWPVVAAVIVAVVAVALVSLLLPDSGKTAASKERESNDRTGSTADRAPGVTGTGERIVEGDEASVGGGRDTRLISGAVTVLIPAGSVEAEGTIRVVRVPKAETPEGLTRVAEAVNVTLEGTTQSGPLTMEVMLPEEVGPVSFQATEDRAGGCCEVEAGVWDPTRKVLVSTVEHLSVKSFFAVAVEDLEAFAKGLIGDRFSSQLASVGPPVCRNDDYPQTNGWAIASDNDESIKWCLNRIGAGGRELRIRNAARHAIALRYPAGFPAVRPELPFGLSSLFVKASEALVSQRSGLVVLQRGDEATVDVSSIPRGYYGTMTASPDVLTWTGDLFDIAVDVLVATFARVPSWAKPSEVRAFANRALILDSLDQMECVTAMASGAELTSADQAVLSRVAGRLSACLQDWLSTKGLAGWLVAALSAVVGIPGATLSALISAGSILLDGADYSIHVNRLAPTTVVAPTSPTTPTTPTPRSPSTPSTVPSETCPTMALGRWTGRWESGAVESGGTLEAMIDSEGSQLTGTVEVHDSNYLQGGAMAGSVNCGHVRFGRIDRLISFEAELGANGRTMYGTYLLYDSEHLVDSGNFSAEFRG